MNAISSDLPPTVHQQSQHRLGHMDYQHKLTKSLHDSLRLTIMCNMLPNHGECGSTHSSFSSCSQPLPELSSRPDSEDDQGQGQAPISTALQRGPPVRLPPLQVKPRDAGKRFQTQVGGSSQEQQILPLPQQSASGIRSTRRNRDDSLLLPPSSPSCSATETIAQIATPELPCIRPELPPLEMVIWELRSCSRGA